MLFRTMILAVALVASGNLSAKVTKEESYSFPLNDGGRLSVTNVNGSVTVTGGSGDTVEIIAVKKADDQKTLDGIEVEITHTADSIVIETDLPDSDSWYNWGGNGGQVTYNIMVPEGTNLDSIETVNGNVAGSRHQPCSSDGGLTFAGCVIYVLFCHWFPQLMSIRYLINLFID